MNIVILGATGGIGSSILSHLKGENNIYFGSKSISKINDLISNTANKNILKGSQIDASSFDEMKGFIDNANKELGSIDCIINCVGSILLKPAHTTTEDELLDVLKTNLFSCFSIIKYSFKYLRKNGGSIIFFSSAAAKVGLKNHEAISSAKGAISSLVQSSASTYAKYNIRINAIAPGLVDSPLTKHIVENEISLDFSKKMHALNKIGETKNFIPAIDFLINPRSDWITGQTISIDGGLSNLK